MAEPEVAVVIVSFNTREHLLRCLESLDDERMPLDVVVVDNASGDGSAEAAARAFPHVRVLRNGENVGFARANNRGLAETRAPLVLLLNSDAELRPGCLETLVALMHARPRVGIVGPRTLESDGAVQVSFGPALTPWREWQQRRLVTGVKRRDPAALRAAAAAASFEHEPDWVSASCLLARREALDAVGGFDEGYFLYEEDADLCRRVRAAGWTVLFTPTAEAVHHLGQSAASDPERAYQEYQRSHLRYYARHNGAVSRAALRAYVAATAAARWLAALGPGPARAARRQASRTLLGLAVRGG